MMKLLNKGVSLLLALLITLLCTVPALAVPEENVIQIYNADDLIWLSEQCTLDSWSQGKTVILMNDIDLTLSDFQPIPTFGGTFEGQGHSISVPALPDSGDVSGLFRYVQACGTIRDLTVYAASRHADSRSTLGGIAGSNSGTISNCSFRGDVRGKSSVGGIAGINQSGGQIVNCSYYGTLTGEHYVGGIAGQNFGSIIQCENFGAINNTEVKSTTNLENIDLSQLNSTENSTGCTDIGGIVGFSSGVVQSCHNYGEVGYPHMGYNVGGIAGRQTGYMDSCTNSGTVRGRKDVGGIVGQIEPQTTLKYDDSTMNSIWSELNSLERMIDAFLTDTENTSHHLSDRVQGVSDSAAVMKDAVSALANAFTGWADSGLDQINDVSARLAWVLERADPIMDVVEQAISSMESAAGLFSDGFSQAGTAMALGGDAAAEMNLAMEDMELAVADARAAISSINRSLTLLKTGLGNTRVIEQNLDKLADGLSQLAEAFVCMTISLEKIRAAMDSVYTWVSTDPGWAQLKEGADALRDAMQVVSLALSDISAAIEQISANEDFSGAMALLASGTKKLMSGAENLAEALQLFADAYEDFRNNTENPNITESLLGLTGAFEALSIGASQIAEGSAEIRQAITILQGSEELAEQIELLKAGLVKLSEGLGAVGEASSVINEALDVIDASSVPEDALEVLDQELAIVSIQLTAMSLATEKISNALSALNDNLSISSLEASLTALQQATKELDAAAEDLSGSISHIGSAMDLIEQTADQLRISLDTFSDGTTALEGSIALMKQAVTDFDSIIEELVSMPEIKLEHIEDSVSDEGAALDAAADDFIEQCNQLNAAMREESTLLVDDLQAINAQVGSIVDLLHRFQQEQEENESEKHLEDVSDQSANDSRSMGKISSCSNSGTIEGDLNVAGIAGSIAIEYDFDPEDDLTISGSRTLNSRYLIKAVVYGSVNRGDIISKKDSAGGIVGSMDFGQVSHCQSYGPVSSSSGSYVGGIVGTCYGTIRSCWAMCRLAGDDYVGGIAGLGSIITDCRTLVSTENSGPCFGAIAGQVDENSELSGNQFVHHELAGVDGVSYQAKAEPVSYDELCAVEDLPEEFTRFELTFTADQAVVAVIPFRYGDALDELPSIPQKAGHSAAWPELDYTFLSFSSTLEAVYTPFTTTLSDGEAIPQYLVSGSFGPESSLSVTSEDAIWSDAEGNRYSGTAYTVTVTGNSAKDTTYTLHWRLPDEGKYELWVLQNGVWALHSYTPDGRYLLLNSTGESITFCLTPQVGLSLLLPILAAAAVIVILSTILLVRRAQKKRRTKSAAANAANE